MAPYKYQNLTGTQYYRSFGTTILDLHNGTCVGSSKDFPLTDWFCQHCGTVNRAELLECSKCENDRWSDPREEEEREEALNWSEEYAIHPPKLNEPLRTRKPVKKLSKIQTYFKELGEGLKEVTEKVLNLLGFKVEW